MCRSSQPSFGAGAKGVVEAQASAIPAAVELPVCEGAYSTPGFWRQMIEAEFSRAATHVEGKQIPASRVDASCGLKG